MNDQNQEPATEAERIYREHFHTAQELIAQNAKLIAELTAVLEKDDE